MSSFDWSRGEERHEKREDSKKKKKNPSTLCVLLVVLFLALRNVFTSEPAHNRSFPQIKSFFVSLCFWISTVALKKMPHCLKLFKAKSARPYQSAFSHEEAGLWFLVSAAANEGYTTVHTVLSVVSNLTALASVGFMLVSYMGFSNDACPFVFSCPA